MVIRLNVNRMSPIAFDNFTPRFIDGVSAKSVPAFNKDDTTFIGVFGNTLLTFKVNE